MAALSPKKREIRNRAAMILDTSRELLLADGLHGITMDRIATATGCPKATLYRCFSCKEDIAVALATRATDKRTEMIRRATTFEGCTRERMLALGEATDLFFRLHAGDYRVMCIATGSVREKASEKQVSKLLHAEGQAIHMVREILVEAVLKRELMLAAGCTVEKIAFGMWALTDGIFALLENDSPQRLLGIDEPFTSLFENFNVLADGYGWRPFSTDPIYENTIGRIQQTVFLKEALALQANEAAR